MVPENQNLNRDLHVCVLQNQPNRMLDKDKKPLHERESLQE